MGAGLISGGMGGSAPTQETGARGSSCVGAGGPAESCSRAAEAEGGGRAARGGGGSRAGTRAEARGAARGGEDGAAAAAAAARGPATDA